MEQAGTNKTKPMAAKQMQAFHELAHNEVASAIAQALLQGFDKHYRIFSETNRAAKQRFENGDWQAVQQATRERIDFYDQRVKESAERLEREFHADSLDDVVWQQVKLQFIALLTNHKQPECAETFFNSVCCRLLHRSYYHNNFIFVRPTISTEHMEDSDPPSYRCYYARPGGLRSTLRKIVEDFGLKRPFADLGQDIRHVLRACRLQLPRPFKLEADYQIQVLSSLFYRNKGAYIVGIVVNDGNDFAFVVPILHDPDGKLYLDAILLDSRQLAIFFSSNRAYFMVCMDVPSAYMSFLSRMLPSKPKWEIYTILGLQKQGKTLFYRDFLHHLKHSSDAFTVAAGIRGLVMTVFTLPSYPYVFKVIKDVFAPPKEIDRDTVKAKYHLVKHHDRVGRMADTLEYSDVAFPRSRFTAELLRELRKEAGSSIEEEGEAIIIKHLYMERRMIPLNLYLDTANAEQREHAIQEYGMALKQLAAANIFAGDLLYKNFGFTRYGRVVFYDYDEIDYLTNCNFRHIPPPRSEEDELCAEPWYSVSPHDIFPEEFERFLMADERVAQCFRLYHPELLRPEYWQAVQKRIAAGHVEDVFPYPEQLRFCNMFARNRPPARAARRNATIQAPRLGGSV
jgi:isocitrate dehydrogenase kinase/phosphatase